MKNILNFLKTTMTAPKAFGWFHLISLVIMILILILIGIFLKRTNEKQNKIIILTYTIIVILFEIYKQVVFAYDVNTGVWNYQWYAFPFQFCSTPMYIALLSLFLRNGKVRDSLYAFLSTFGLLGGLIVMIMPGDVFTSTVGINIQTMINHGGQVLLGAYLLISKQTKLDFKTPLRAMPVFATLMAIALVLNVTIVKVATTGLFNMFFISPYFPSTLPIFNVIYNSVPYIVFLLIYFLAFSLGAYIISLIALLLSKIKPKRSS